MQPFSSWETRIKSIFDAEDVIDSDKDSSGYRTRAEFQNLMTRSAIRSSQPIYNASARIDDDTIPNYHNPMIRKESGSNPISYSVQCTEASNGLLQVTAIMHIAFSNKHAKLTSFIVFVVQGSS